MDIIICTYNNADLLKRSLATLAKQRFLKPRSWSVMVVDNNCTDQTARVCDDYICAQTIPGLRRIVEQNQGLAYARLCGVNNTSSEWLAFVDEDCLLAENWVEQAIEFAASHPRCGAFGGKVILDWENKPSPLLAKHARSFSEVNRGDKIQKLSRRDFHIPGAGLVIQRAALKESGWIEQQFLNDREGDKNRFSAGGDSEIILRILNVGYELWYTPSCILHHYIPSRRISENYLADLTYGLGLSAPYIACFRWHYSFKVWFGVSILNLIRHALKAVFLTAISIVKPNARMDSMIRWRWIKGQAIGLVNIIKPIDKEQNKWLNLFKQSQM